MLRPVGFYLPRKTGGSTRFRSRQAVARHPNGDDFHLLMQLKTAHLLLQNVKGMRDHIGGKQGEVGDGGSDVRQQGIFQTENDGNVGGDTQPFLHKKGGRWQIMGQILKDDATRRRIAEEFAERCAIVCRVFSLNGREIVASGEGRRPLGKMLFQLRRKLLVVRVPHIPVGRHDAAVTGLPRSLKGLGEKPNLGDVESGNQRRTFTNPDGGDV